ncbi:MAG: hypothetical protein JXJ04_18375 [Spirochaetales bacterium]|nr:hypothetical protein [Spirochaetales bacterium]
MHLFLISIIILSGGCILCLIDFSGRLRFPGPFITLAGAGCAISSALRGLYFQAQPDIIIHWQIPFASFHIGTDALTCFFIIPISLVCGLAAVYSYGYINQYAGKKNNGLYWFFFNLLFLAMLLVISSKNGMLFLVSWEMMSVASFFLVIYEHEKPKTIQAGWIYLIAMHIGAACLLVLFLLLDTRGNMDFRDFIISKHISIIAFVLGIVGFGTKAGLIPMHTWLPEAHPAAPSPVSGIMSGVMIKTGIYGILRLVTFAGEIPPWWGWALLFLGGVSGITGILYALAQNNIKRLLAYSSVENVGIITLSLGLGLLGISYHNPAVALLGICGGLLHILNHGIFKSLLFFSAGAVIKSTGTPDIEQMGGLIKRMPVTALVFLIGSVSICALPPCNGFAGEFLIYIASFISLPDSGMWSGGLLSLTNLAVIGVLAVLCFTKVFGIVFLGQPRSVKAENAHEVDSGMIFPMIIPAVLCLGLGIASPYLSGLFLPVVSLFIQIPPDLFMLQYTESLIPVSLFSIGIIALVLVIISLRILFSPRRPIREVSTWDCGYHAGTPRMQYTGSSFADPVLKMFRYILGRKTVVDIKGNLFPKQGTLISQSIDLFMRRIYQPFFGFFRLLSIKFYWLKSGNTHLYVLYIALTIIILFLFTLR